MEKKNSIYHFAGNDYYKIADITKIICQLKSYSYSKLIKITAQRKGQDIIYKLNSTKTKKELKWKPLYSLKKALIQVINYGAGKFSKENLVYIDSNFKKKN